VSEIPKIARARLEQQATGAGNHPDADQLTAFVERSLGAREREQVLEHLSRCAPCREVVAVALSLPPEEAARATQPAREFRWFEWQTLRWAAVAATLVIAVSLVFQMYREAPATESRETAQNQPVAATAPALAKQTEAARADEAQPRQAFGAAKEKAPSSSTVAVLRDQETEVTRGPSKLDSVNRAKTEEKSGELAGVSGGRMDDSRKLGSEGKVEVAGGTLARKPARKPASPAPKMAAEPRRGPAAPAAQQQQVAGLAQQAPPSPPATRDEVQRQAAAEPASRAAADRTESVQVSGQNEVVNVGKDADQRARNAAPAGGFAASRKMSSASATMRWIITAEGRVERTMDSGQTWKEAALDRHIKFRAVAATGSDVWAGGEAGALYRSSDSGAHWSRVSLPAELASATIVRVEFPSAEHGTLTTSAGETWATSDSGASWQKK
jgi:hypothetical protein